ncbi:hypothetical protein HDZ31DRAFT_83599 [Schizophyllum fasciatum]
MSKIEQADSLMHAFISRSGLEPPSRAPRRYLWTDAFAVCNLITLHRHLPSQPHAAERAPSQERLNARVIPPQEYPELRTTAQGTDYLSLARKLVDQVHNTLGRHRPDDTLGRQGWLSGITDEEGAAHPTKGGLRIGKPLPERRGRQGIRSWNGRRTARYLVWAIELAKVAHARFVHSSGTRMYWKMSVDLSRPAVRSMGQHDALDALAKLALDSETQPALDLSTELADAARMCARGIADANGQTKFQSREALLRDVSVIRSHERLGERIEGFWMEEGNRQTRSWVDHEDINAVMLATTLAPDAFLEV